MDDLKPAPSENRGAFMEPRLSERNFRRYEECIAAITQRFPEEVRFDRPTDRSMNYFIGRFRDAIGSYLRFNWKSDIIDRDRLIEIRKKFILTPDPAGTHVWARQRQKKALSAYAAASLPLPDAGTNIKSTWLEPDDDEAKALAYLIARARVSGIFVLKGKLASHSYIENNYPVSITYNQERNETVIT